MGKRTWALGASVIFKVGRPVEGHANRTGDEYRARRNVCAECAEQRKHLYIRISQASPVANPVIYSADQHLYKETPLVKQADLAPGN